MPGNPYVLQHRSILERDLENPEEAIRFAREAVSLERHNPALQNTLGLALEFAARFGDDVLRRQAYRKEAAKIFDEGVTRKPSDPFPYIGKANLLRQETTAQENAEKRTVLRAQALALLQAAHEATFESPIIAAALAEEWRNLGDADEAARIVDAAIAKKPADDRLRDIQISLLEKQGKLDEALQSALAGIKLSPTSWRIHRQAARPLTEARW